MRSPESTAPQLTPKRKRIRAIEASSSPFLRVPCLWPQAKRQRPRRGHSPGEGAAYLGFTLLVAAVLAGWKRERKKGCAVSRWGGSGSHTCQLRPPSRTGTEGGRPRRAVPASAKCGVRLVREAPSHHRALPDPWRRRAARTPNCRSLHVGLGITASPQKEQETQKCPPTPASGLAPFD